jgi:HTH-type transcriptional regulator/antitoxin HipB
LRLLNAGITLSQDEPSPANAAPVAKMASSNRLAAPGRNAPALKAEKRAPTGAAAQGTRQAPRKPAATPDGRASARAPRTASAPKKREQW